MPRKTPATERWGGPGASHENRDKRQPAAPKQYVRDRTKVHSHVSGGGGEHDVHHGHSDKAKRDFEENRVQKSRE